MILRLVALRLTSAGITLFAISIIIFLMVEALPGDVATAILGQFASEEAREALRERLHLNDPAIERYLRWLAGVLTGNLGEALSSQRSVAQIIAAPIVNTLILSGAALLLYVPISLLTAVTQALRPDGVLDHILSTVTLVLTSLPDYLLALLLLALFVVVIPLLPAVSTVTESTDLVGWLTALALPAMTLAIVMAVYAARMLRDNLIEVLDSNHVRMARIRGLSRSSILWRHALPGAIVPTLNVTALNLTYLAGGVVIVEKVFGYPGFGSLMIDAIRFRDIPLIEITVLIASSVYVLANLLADLGALLFNPKLRQSRR